jgi:hypothetical protein|uniref:Uncharacterized protein n=1 Tax=viral metagenome TaxID=1070528 RepID=A0A6C0IRA6_9ZZZZ
MSIVALKRKTDATYKNLSTNQPTGFSLNGTRRLQGYVGQTSLSRHLSFTPMKGTVIKGHGGCCGTYTTGPIVRSASSINVEDNTVVKGSVLTTAGMLAERFNCSPCNTVKPTMQDQSDYSKKLKKKAIACDTNEYRTTCSTNTSLKVSILSRLNFAKPVSAYSSISSGEQVDKLNKKCTDNDPNLIPFNVKKTPFAGST